MVRLKAIIIGSGMGGLSAGVFLAKNGYDVTVLEQGIQAGGCLQCFSRGGVRFETGMHFIGSADPGQTLYQLFDYLEILPDIKLSRLDTQAYNTISLAGEHFHFANGREAFIETLLQRFPGAGDDLKRYFDTIEEVAKVCGLSQMQNPSASDVLTRYQLLPMDEVIDQTVSNAELRNVLCGDIPLYAAQKGKTPFALHAQLMDFYNRSAFRIRGGSDALAHSMIATIRRYEGEVLTHSRVTKVICNDTKATRVEVNGCEFLPADIIISAIHPQVLLPLLDTALIRPAYRSRIASIPNTTSVFSLYLKFKKDSMPYMNTNHFAYADSTPWNCETYDDESWPKGYLYMHLCPEKESPWAESGEVLVYQNMSECERWRDTHIGHRGKDYKAWKIEKAEKILNLMERDFPDIRSHIDRYYTASPLTYRDYNGTPEGSMYGVHKDVNAGPANRISYRTRIPNLLLVGQNINSHGILGVLVGTVTSCSTLTDSNKVAMS